MIDATAYLNDILSSGIKTKWIKKISKHDLTNKKKLGEIKIRELRKILSDNICKIIKCSGDYPFETVEVHYKFNGDNYRDSGLVLILVVHK